MVACSIAKDGAVEYWCDDQLIYDISQASLIAMGQIYWAGQLKAKSWMTPDLFDAFLVWVTDVVS